MAPRKLPGLLTAKPNPAGKDIARMAPQYGMTQDRFLLLIEGMEADVQGRVYKNFEELQWYLWRVAGIVGLATLDILGIKGPHAQELASALGFAVQLTNIVRDVHEDTAPGPRVPAGRFTG